MNGDANLECPACSNPLIRRNCGGVEVDVCEHGCAGIWFDNFELEKFDEPHEHAGEALLDITRNPNVNVDHSKRISCPKCAGIVMMRHFFSAKHQVEVDECPSCRGYWIDDGELRQIRSLFNTEQERHSAADRYFADILGEELEVLRESDSVDQSVPAKITDLMGYLCPRVFEETIARWLDLDRKLP